MDKIVVKHINILDQDIEVQFDYTDGVAEYFSSGNDAFRVNYSEIIYGVPKSIAVIPFVANVLPLVWLTNSILEIDELDEVFYNSIPDFKMGYEKMYPMFSFRGKIEVCAIEKNNIRNNRTAMFFSGGVDAFATLIKHRFEKPKLITLFGADIKLTDNRAIDIVRARTIETSKYFGLPAPYFVTSNFRQIINEGTLNRLVRKSSDGWWHGFQHGIGIICHAAPIAYINEIGLIYIASSNVKGHHNTCASDESIDNYVKYGATTIHHDQFGLNRQEKIHTIVDYCKKRNDQVFLRVCWQSVGGCNCCHCEKCYRTIFAIIAEGGDPEKLGFKGYKKYLNNAEHVVKRALLFTNTSVKDNWQVTINKFREEKNLSNDSRMDWILILNPYMPYPKLIRHLLEIYNLMRSIIIKIKKAI